MSEGQLMFLEKVWEKSIQSEKMQPEDKLDFFQISRPT